MHEKKHSSPVMTDELKWLENYLTRHPSARKAVEIAIRIGEQFPKKED